MNNILDAVIMVLVVANWMSLYAWHLSRRRAIRNEEATERAQSLVQEISDRLRETRIANERLSKENARLHRQVFDLSQR